MWVGYSVISGNEKDVITDYKKVCEDIDKLHVSTLPDVHNLNNEIIKIYINNGGRTLEQFFSASRYTLSHIIFILMKIMCDKVYPAAKKISS